MLASDFAASSRVPTDRSCRESPYPSSKQVHKRITREAGWLMIGVFGLLIAGNLLAWAWTLIVFGGKPPLVGAAALSYVLGLKHGRDADHIAAIDNVVRRLMRRGKRPVSVGLLFSLGHSTVVIIVAVMVAVSAQMLQSQFESWRHVAGIVATVVSATFLIAIALSNMTILKTAWRNLRLVRSGVRRADEDLEVFLSDAGFMTRIFRPLFKWVSESWHMYPIGMLFGLGFETASEVALLGVAASHAAQGMSIWWTMVFPVLFTAGMALVDTADSALMVGAYGWVFAEPVRKLWYNLTITAVSVVMAIAIAALEVLDLLARSLGWNGLLSGAVAQINDHLGLVGAIVVSVFLTSWLASALVYRLNRYGELSNS